MLPSALKLPQNPRLEENVQRDKPVAKRGHERQRDGQRNFNEALTRSQQAQQKQRQVQSERQQQAKEFAETRASERKATARQMELKQNEQKQSSLRNAELRQADLRKEERRQSHERRTERPDNRSQVAESKRQAPNHEVARREDSHIKATNGTENQEQSLSQKERGEDNAQNKDLENHSSEVNAEKEAQSAETELASNGKSASKEEATARAAKTDETNTGLATTQDPQTEFEAQLAKLLAQDASGEISEQMDLANEITNEEAAAEQANETDRQLQLAHAQSQLDVDTGLESESEAEDAVRAKNSASQQENEAPTNGLTNGQQSMATRSEQNMEETNSDELARSSEQAATEQWLDSLIKLVKGQNETSQPNATGETLVTAGSPKEPVVTASQDDNVDADPKSKEQDDLAALMQLIKGEGIESSDAVDSELALDGKAQTQTDKLSEADLDKVLKEGNDKQTPMEQLSILSQQVQQALNGSDQKTTSPINEPSSNTTSFQASRLQSMINGQVAATGQMTSNGEAGQGSSQAQTSTQELAQLQALNTQGESENSSLDKLALSELRQGLQINSAAVTGAGESSGKPSQVDVMGVQLDRTLVAPKLESLSQAKQDAVIRENVLFNKQELATNVQQQVGLMMARNMKSVDIRLDPPELGSMQIKLNINNDQAAVSFVVSSQQAKDALEGSLPKLRELLEQQGLELADSDVKQERQQGEAGDNEQDGQHAREGQGVVSEEAEGSPQTIHQRVNSPWSVDYYA